VLLGKVVEAITKKTFAAAVQAAIIDPLQLRTASFGDWQDIQPGRAQWYSIVDFDKQDFSVAEPFVLKTTYQSYRWPSAGLFISAEDLARFVDALGSGRVLRPTTLDSYWKPITISSGASQEFGLGSWYIDNSIPGGFKLHEGGVRAAVAYGRDERLTIVVLTNLQGANPFGWIEEIRSLYAPSRATTEKGK
jgi:CubicO group peptidase (beta-lactamase class C family)